MESRKSKVYVQTDERNRIIRCEGGYSMGNIEDISQWTLIDGGNGDKYNLCQSNYFPEFIYTIEGIPRYKLIEDTSNHYGVAAMERTAEEIAADIAALPPPGPSYQDLMEYYNTTKEALGE